MTNTIESIAPVSLPGAPDHRASSAAFAEYGRICGMLVVSARPMTVIKQTGAPDLIVASRSWPAGCDNGAVAAAMLEAGNHDGYVLALGTPESVLLSSDGRAWSGARFCWCGDVSFDDSVYVERWTPEGRAFHGWIHRQCRYLTQVG